MRLLVVRHGATADNEQKRYLGQIDAVLSPLGGQQAERVAALLAREPVDLIVTSDLQRARATAQVIARHHDVPLEEDADLRELARGVWEGATYGEVQARYPELLARWRRTPAECRIPGGETLGELRHRVGRAAERWYVRAPKATAVWVTHAGVIQVLLCYLLNVDLNSWRRFYPDNASITPVQVECIDGTLIGSLEASSLPAFQQG